MSRLLIVEIRTSKRAIYTLSTHTLANYRFRGYDQYHITYLILQEMFQINWYIVVVNKLEIHCKNYQNLQLKLIKGFQTNTYFQTMITKPKEIARRHTVSIQD